ncbi:NAD(P)-dependent alcohol dehydrogenase [Vulgatibacter sp.]|uniref:NAD(P)-dependent alcohol dehydrogenase n=1 Tax=Vulgatibacter sp. TaxID=1971226 RepID=UPI003569360D
MKAAIVERFGPPEVIRWGERPRPAPKASEILVAVEAAALNPVDARLRGGYLSWLTSWRLPRGTGLDFAGVVAEVGAKVEGFRPGDAVFGSLPPLDPQGSCSEFVRVAPAHLARNEAGLAPEVAAALGTAGCAALAAVESVRAGERCLVIGASGSVGFLAAQLARSRGAEVTVVTSGRHVERLRAAGFTRLIDYERAPLQSRPERFDVVIEAAGASDFAALRHLLADRGTFVALSPTASMVLHHLRALVTRGPRLRLLASRVTPACLAHLAAEVAAGRLLPPPIETMPPAAIVEAHRRLESKHAGAKLVVRLR